MMPPAYLACLALLGLADLLLLGWIWVTGTYGWASENGLVENFQAAVLLAAAGLFARRMIAATASVRPLYAAGTALAAIFFLRELDFRPTGLPESFVELFHGGGKHALSAAIGVALLVYLAAQWRAWRRLLRTLLQPRLAAYAVGGLFLVLGSVFEDLPGRGFSQVLEEVAEMTGFLLVLLAGLFLPFREPPAAAPRR